MALRDMLNDVMLETRQPISDSDFIRWYNDCLRDLARRYDTAKRTVETTITGAIADGWNSLTANNMGVIRVLDDEGFPTRYKTRDGGEIQFPFDGTYTVFERLPQTPITAMSATPTIDSQFEDAIALYIAAKAMQNTAVELSVMKLAEYKEAAEMANRTVRGANHRNAQVAVPDWP